MQVQCPQCSSRYKLPDEKIRPSGTKVRCPRCQHAFYVHPKQDAESAPQPFRPEPPPAPPPPPPLPPPEAFSRRPAQPPPTRPMPNAPAKVSEDRPFAKKSSTSEKAQEYSVEPSIPDFVESARTMVSSVGDSVQPDEKRTTSPFKGLSKASFSVDQPDDVEDFSEATGELADKPRTAPRDSAPTDLKDAPEVTENSPFGNATFAEIQNIKASKTRKKFPLVVAAGVVMVAGLAALLIYSPTPHVTVVQQPSPETPPDNKVSRPSRWYADEPSIFQDFLGQMAGLPATDQSRPERRGLIADALVLNGILTGTNEQIVSGLGYASSLIAAYPQNAYGYYALSTFAFFQEDIQTLEDLTKRWPNELNPSVEFQISKAMVDAKKGDYSSALKSAKILLNIYPDSPRIQITALYIGLENPQQSDEVYGERSMYSLAKKFDKYIQALKTQTSTLPVLYKTIEKRVHKKNILAEPSASKNENSKSEIAKKNDDQPMNISTITEPTLNKPSETPVPTTILSPGLRATPTPKIPPKSNKLPKADPQLIALNTTIQNAHQKAMKFFNQGKNKLDLNRQDEAIELFQKALREDPNLAEAYKQLGVIYMGRQVKDKALRQFKLYLQLKPDGDDKQLVESWITSMQ